MDSGFSSHLRHITNQLRENGLYKIERPLLSDQSASIEAEVNHAQCKMINLCANNYLGFANHPEIIQAAQEALQAFGFGMASVRFICGTHRLHQELEEAIALYVGQESAIVFPSCFDANGSIFEALLEAEDAIFSDSLNHASIIDGIRLCKARRYRFPTGDMKALKDCLESSHKAGGRFKIIVTDGVFSMDGFLANLPEICTLAQSYGALVMVDDCHATGHIGPEGRGTAAATHTRVDIVSGTFGKTLGGASGGFIASRQEIIDLLRQKARAYLFSNSLAPSLAAGALKAIQLAKTAEDRRNNLKANTALFREHLTQAGFELLPGQTPIIPVMFHEASRAVAMANALSPLGIYVAAFSYPVVPQNQARIRVQMSSQLTLEEVAWAAGTFKKAAKDLQLLK